MLPTSIATLRGQHLLDAWKRDIRSRGYLLATGCRFDARFSAQTRQRRSRMLRAKLQGAVDRDEAAYRLGSLLINNYIYEVSRSYVGYSNSGLIEEIIRIVLKPVLELFAF